MLRTLKNSKNHENLTESQESPVDEYLNNLKPHLDRAHAIYQSTKTQWNNAVSSVKFHYNKAKDAIKETNVKLAQQEKELATYDFNEDFTRDGKDRSKIIGLPSERERRRKLWAKRLELYIDSLQETIFTATRALNDVTGYSAIQKLRESIDALETELVKAKEMAKKTKEIYNEAISKRLETQKEVNELLQRKSTWNSQDLEKFTGLYKDDHANAANEKQAKLEMEQAELHQEELHDKLSNAILTRYHEEQIWSDKIRRTSTWGTFGLMGINIFLFLIFQLALEPWKRRRLVGNFEEKVQRVLEENTNEQNQRLELMSQKMEALKNSDRLPALEERLQSEVVDDIDLQLVQPPTIQELPLPLIKDWKHKLREHFAKLINPLREPYALLFYSDYDHTVLDKTELISVVSLAVSFGTFIGSLIVYSIGK
jgi:sensitive to high expression protein 9